MNQTNDNDNEHLPEIWEVREYELSDIRCRYDLDHDTITLEYGSGIAKGPLNVRFETLERLMLTIAEVRRGQHSHNPV